MLYRNLLALATIIALGIPSLHSQADEALKQAGREGTAAKDFEKLTGINSLFVYVENYGADKDFSELASNELKAAVELRLRQNRVIIDDEMALKPYLSVSVHAIKLVTDDSFIIRSEVFIQEPIFLSRVKKMTFATTWKKTKLSFCRTHDLGEGMKQSVDSLMTFFLNDYLAANPGTER